LLSANGVSSKVVTTNSVATVTVSSSSTSSHHVFENVATTTTVTTEVGPVASSISVQVVGVLQIQTTGTENAALNDQVAQHDSTTTTTVNASTAPATSLGQSVSQQLTTSDRATEDNSQPIKQVNDPEPAMPAAPASETPTDPLPVPDAAPQKESEPATAPAAPAPPIESMPDRSPTLFDAALEAIGDGWSTPRSQRSNEPRVVDPELPREDREPASSTPSTLAGTAAVAAAGVYWFTLRQADRKKSRWMPGRI
jgi:hypothetical protein